MVSARTSIPAIWHFLYRPLADTRGPDRSWRPVQSVWQQCHGRGGELRDSGGIGSAAAGRARRHATVAGRCHRARRAGGRFSAFGEQDTANGPVDGLVSVGRRDSGDIRRAGGQEAPEDAELDSLLLKGGWRPDDENRLFAQWQRYDETSTQPANPQQLDVEDDPRRRQVTSDNVQLGHRWRPAAASEVTSRLSLSRQEIDEDDANRTLERWGLQSDGYHRIEHGWLAQTLVFGAEVDRASQRPGGGASGFPHADIDTQALYLEDTLTVGRHLSEGGVGVFDLGLGARYDRYDAEDAAGRETEETQLSPRLRLSWRPVRGLMFYSGYAEAFRLRAFPNCMPISGISPASVLRRVSAFPTTTGFPIPTCSRKPAVPGRVALPGSEATGRCVPAISTPAPMTSSTATWISPPARHRPSTSIAHGSGASMPPGLGTADWPELRPSPAFRRSRARIGTAASLWAVKRRWKPRSAPIWTCSTRRSRWAGGGVSPIPMSVRMARARCLVTVCTTCSWPGRSRRPSTRHCA